MAALVKLRQNTKRRWIGAICTLVGIIGYFCAKGRLEFWLPSIFLWLGGTFISAVGVDYAIGEAFLKIGFTRVPWDQISRVIQSSPSQLLVVTVKGKTYALRQCDFTPASWQLLVGELLRREIPITPPETRVTEEW